MNVALPLDALLPSALPAAPGPTQTGSGADPASPKEVSAAKDFEALLIGQMLRSAHEDGSGWLGTEDDDAGATAMSLGEEELAKAMAQGGGFGLAKVIASGLAARRAAGDPANPK